LVAMDGMPKGVADNTCGGANTHGAREDKRRG
jgi:hypothetical protein